MMSTKGIVLTLDSILALVIAASMIVVMLNMTESPEYTSKDYLYSYMVDFLTVAEKDLTLRKVVEGNNTPANDFLHSQPDNLCFNLSIYDEQGNMVYTNSTDCSDKGWNVMVKRSFLEKTSFYMAELKGWYR